MLNENDEDTFFCRDLPAKIEKVKGRERNE